MKTLIISLIIIIFALAMELPFEYFMCAGALIVFAFVRIMIKSLKKYDKDLKELYDLTLKIKR